MSNLILFSETNYKNQTSIIAQRTIFPKPWNILESSKSLSKYHHSINVLAQKKPYFPYPKSPKQELFSNLQTWYFMIKKISSYCFCFVLLCVCVCFFCFFFKELKDHLSRSLKYRTSTVNSKGRSFYQFPALRKISFYSLKSVILTFPLSKKFITWTFPFVRSS